MQWALKLRMFERKIRDQTISIGQISWSDDSQYLTYKKLEFHIHSLRWFIRDQIEFAQRQLVDLLLVEEDERDQIVPRLTLPTLKDDPTIRDADWSFLIDGRNVSLHGHKQ